jgi:hypothetical protein
MIAMVFCFGVYMTQGAYAQQIMDFQNDYYDSLFKDGVFALTSDSSTWNITGTNTNSTLDKEFIKELLWRDQQPYALTPNPSNLELRFKAASIVTVSFFTSTYLALGIVIYLALFELREVLANLRQKWKRAPKARDSTSEITSKVGGHLDGGVSGKHATFHGEGSKTEVEGISNFLGYSETASGFMASDLENQRAAFKVDRRSSRIDGVPLRKPSKVEKLGLRRCSKTLRPLSSNSRRASTTATKPLHQFNSSKKGTTVSQMKQNVVNAHEVCPSTDSAGALNHESKDTSIPLPTSNNDPHASTNMPYINRFPKDPTSPLESQHTCSSHEDLDEEYDDEDNDDDDSVWMHQLPAERNLFVITFVQVDSTLTSDFPDLESPPPSAGRVDGKYNDSRVAPDGGLAEYSRRNLDDMLNLSEIQNVVVRTTGDSRCRLNGDFGVGEELSFPGLPGIGERQYSEMETGDGNLDVIESYSLPVSDVTDDEFFLSQQKISGTKTKVQSAVASQPPSSFGDIFRDSKTKKRKKPTRHPFTSRRTSTSTTPAKSQQKHHQQQQQQQATPPTPPSSIASKRRRHLLLVLELVTLTVSWTAFGITLQLTAAFIIMLMAAVHQTPQNLYQYDAAKVFVHYGAGVMFAVVVFSIHFVLLVKALVAFYRGSGRGAGGGVC